MSGENARNPRNLQVKKGKKKLSFSRRIHGK